MHAKIYNETRDRRRRSLNAERLAVQRDFKSRIGGCTEKLESDGGVLQANHQIWMTGEFA